MLVKCPKCDTENPPDSKYCKECATPLPSAEDISVLPTETLETPVEELSRGTLFADRFEVIEELGTGGMGKIYRVEDKKIKEEVALKLIKPEIAADKKTIERFGNELKLARKIAHRNVCRMYDLGEEKSTHFITMEYVSGEDLKSFIRRVGQLPLAKALSIAGQICEGLSEAHRLGVVHRDLKPGNIMIDEEGNARIMDFGIARSLKAEGITGRGVMIGTPEYMSPEQAETKEVDQRSDIYSLGVILFEMLTGRVPFEGETPLAIAMKHKSEIPPDPRKYNTQIPDDLIQVILKCLEKEKETRYQTADELLAELHKIEEGIPAERVVTKKSITSKEITVKIGLKKLFIPALIVATLVVIAVAIWRLLPRKETFPAPSGKPSLAIMYFENNTGDESLDHYRKAIPDLLITDLAQSRYVRVLSGSRLFNILSQLNKMEAESYSSDVIKEVAGRGGVAHALLGSFTKAGDTFRINVTLQEAQTAELIGSESVEGVGEKSIFPMVDELTRRIKANFKFTDEEIAADIDKEIEEITTGSPEAYKYYVEGRKYHLQGDSWKSLSLMQKALEIDPEFAMAYRSVAMSYSNLGLRPAKRKALEKAFELRDRVSERERYLIEAEYYRLTEHTWDRAMEAYEKILGLYPDDLIANTNLGILYNNLEEYDRAIELYNVNIQNDPDGYMAFWNLAETYEAMGLYEKAREILENYLVKKPDDHRFHRKQAIVYLYEGKYDLALAKLEKVLSLNPKDKLGVAVTRGITYILKGDMTRADLEFKKLSESGVKIRQHNVAISLLQGRYEEAERIIRRKPIMQEQLAIFHLRMEYPEEALKELERVWSNVVKTESLAEQIQTLHFKGFAYLQKQSINEALRTAEEIEELTKKSIHKKNIRFYYHLMGMIELEREKLSKAVKYLSKAKELLYSPNENFPEYNPLFAYTLAEAFYRAKNIEKAQREYESVISVALGRWQSGDFYAKSLYMLGKIFEEKRKKNKAIEYYEKFLHLWKDADPGLPEVEDAEKRLARLQMDGNRRYNK